MKRVVLAFAIFLPALLSALPAAAEIRLKGTARFGLNYRNGAVTQEYRTRIDFHLKGRTEGGLAFGAFTRVSIDGQATGIFSGAAVWIEKDKVRLTLGNTSGAIAARAAIWGCSVGYRGASCADLVTNLQPAGWQPTMTTSSSTGAGPNLIRLDLPLGRKTKMSISGGNGNDLEIALRRSGKPWSIGFGYDFGSGTNGGATLIIDWKKGEWAWGLDIGRYGNFTNVVANIAWKYRKGEELYAYASMLGGAHSVGISWKKKLGGGAMLKAGIESAAGNIMADIGIKFRF